MLFAMMKHKGNKIMTTQALQTDEGDIEFSASPTKPTSKRNKRPGMVRRVDSKVSVRADKSWNFAGLCDEGVKSEAEIDGTGFPFPSASLVRS